MTLRLKTFVWLEHLVIDYSVSYVFLPPHKALLNKESNVVLQEVSNSSKETKQKQKQSADVIRSGTNILLHAFVS